MPPLPSLKIFALLVLASAARTSAQGSPPAGWTGHAAGVAASAPVADGNKLMDAALDRMESNPQLAVKVRYRVALGDVESLGEGDYWHQGVGGDRRSRWQLQARAGDDTLSVVQVYASPYLWTDRRFGSSRRVTRLDLRRLRREIVGRLDALPAGQTSLSPEDAALLARGGISQLLAELQRRYQFTPPRPAAVEGVATWAVVGQWDNAELARLWFGPTATPPAEGFDLAQWPSQLPHHAVVHLSQDRLFPCLIEFRSNADVAAATAVNAVASVGRPLAQYTFVNPQFAAAIDPHVFAYDAGDADWTDETATAVDDLFHPSSAAAAESVAIRNRTVK